MRDWLRRRHYEATGATPRTAGGRSALDLLEARAQFDPPEQAVHVRLAEQAGRIFLLLGAPKRIALSCLHCSGVPGHYRK
jgi:hypothetical protein